IASLCQAATTVWTVGFWLALAAGLLGNSLAIFTIASLPRATSTFYVGLLAVSDLLALCVRGSIHVLTERGIITQAGAGSSLVAMLYDYAASYSNWLLVLIGVERLLTLRFPLQKRVLLTVRRAQASAALLALALLLAYGLAARALDYLDPQVFALRNLLYAVLPLLLNAAIIALVSCQMRRAQRAREKILTIARLENSITVMMLAAAVCFCLLTMPNCLLLYLYEAASRAVWNAPVAKARLILVSRITELLTLLNLSVNFLLYFLSAKKFRAQL
ncbi:hypothetical protein EGW08_004124, partial [Elysia chlorotica]